jgi:hypothetical protein
MVFTTQYQDLNIAIACLAPRAQAKMTLHEEYNFYLASSEKLITACNAHFSKQRSNLWQFRFDC